MDKHGLRKEALSRRDRLAIEDRVEKSLAMADHADRIRFERGAIVSGYLPIRSEPDLRPLLARLRDRGARLCLPVVIDPQTIVFREMAPGAQLVATGFGTSGPPEDAALLDPDIMLMPLSAFDPTGNRLGYGAGHYDRAIARLRQSGRSVHLIGAAFEVQAVEAIPAEPHDVPLDQILTEKGLRTFPAGV